MLKYDLISLKILKSLKDSNQNLFSSSNQSTRFRIDFLIGFDQSTSQSPHVLCRITENLIQISFLLKMNNAIGACIRFLISVNEEKKMVEKSHESFTTP